MQLSELKEELFASISKVEDENVLIEMKQLLERRTENEDLSYEKSHVFTEKINKALKQIENGEVYSHEEAMNYLNNRAWRLK